MKTEKIGFKDIKDVLSRDEMKMIMAGREINCSGVIYGSVYVSGSCSGPDLDTCMQYCANQGWASCSCGYLP